MTKPLDPAQLSLGIDPREVGRPTKIFQRQALRHLLEGVDGFSRAAGALRLRSYQQEAAQAIADSVIRREGMSFVVMFPRQSGKNEVQAQIEAYLLTLFQHKSVEMVKVSPTWKPQALNAMRRLERILDSNRLTRNLWRKEHGFIYRLGLARIYFLSGAPTSNVVGATASLMLECDEAQDVGLLKWDKEINPMAASTNATRVFWGTAWTAETLLGRELRLARLAEERDGRRRVFTLTAADVRNEVPAYGQFVDSEIARLGRNHPMVRTQYFCEELQAQGGMFTPERLALLASTHPPQPGPRWGAPYAFLIDVGGEQQSADSFQHSADSGQLSAVSAQLRAQSSQLTAPHDSTALTIVEIVPPERGDPLALGPTFRTVGRRVWTGTNNVKMYMQIKALIEQWRPQRVVVDATGIGAGLASVLTHSFGKQVQPFIFTSKSKSELGWGFLALIETGRYKEYTAKDPHSSEKNLQDLFYRQLLGCEMEAAGPANLLRWGVPAGRRDPLLGGPLHDDLVISAALCASLEDGWGTTESVVIPPKPWEW